MSDVNDGKVTLDSIIEEAVLPVSGEAVAPAPAAEGDDGVDTAQAKPADGKAPDAPADEGDKSSDPGTEPEDIFAGISDDMLDDSAKEMKKRLRDAYLRKTNELAQKSKEVEAEVNEVEKLRAEIAELRKASEGRPSENKQVEPSDDSYFESLGLGKKLSGEDLDTAEDFTRYAQQQAALAKREAMNYVQPVIQELAVLRNRVFLAEHPDAIANQDAMLAWAKRQRERGYEVTIEDAYEAVVAAKRGVVSEESVAERELRAYELGVQAAKAQAERLQDTRSRISVPSGEPAARGTVREPLGANASFEEVFSAARDELGME